MTAVAESLPQVAAGASFRAPLEARRRADRLLDKRAERADEAQRLAARLEQINQYQVVAGKVTVALEQLNEQLFKQVLGTVQDKLTIALQEILDQPIAFRAQSDFKRGAATVDFWIERDGNPEDVLRGHGGSVANILSVGLRMFALITLDESRHRRFLVLDEQDCWLRPDLVPKLVNIVHKAGKELNFQVLMISHHSVGAFVQYADRIYEISPHLHGTAQVRQLMASPSEPDSLF